MRYRRSEARFLRPMRARAVRGEPLWGVALLSIAPPTWRPAFDACETSDGLVVVVDVAGLEDDDIEVTLFADALVVEGERRLDLSGGDGRYDRAEIRQGPFRVETALPFPVDAERVEAAYERGLLRISLPRPRDSSGRPSGRRRGSGHARGTEGDS